jgi:hypothetical protein
MHRPQLGCSPPHFTFRLRQGSQEKALFLIDFTEELGELDIGAYHDGWDMGQSLSMSMSVSRGEKWADSSWLKI